MHGLCLEREGFDTRDSSSTKSRQMQGREGERKPSSSLKRGWPQGLPRPSHWVEPKARPMAGWSGLSSSPSLGAVLASQALPHPSLIPCPSYVSSGVSSPGLGPATSLECVEALVPLAAAEPHSHREDGLWHWEGRSLQLELGRDGGYG